MYIRDGGSYLPRYVHHITRKSLLSQVTVSTELLVSYRVMLINSLQTWIVIYVASVVLFTKDLWKVQQEVY